MTQGIPMAAIFFYPEVLSVIAQDGITCRWKDRWRNPKVFYPEPREPGNRANRDGANPDESEMYPGGTSRDSSAASEVHHTGEIQHDKYSRSQT